MRKIPDLTQRAREWEFAVFDGGAFRAEFRQTEMRTGRVVKRQRFTGETAHMDAERAFMDAVIPVVHGGGE